MASGMQPPRHVRTIVLVIASSLLMEQLDATVLVTALPTMARELHTAAPNLLPAGGARMSFPF